jgi:hypothetical protein
MINVYQFHYEEIENKKYLLNKTFCFFLFPFLISYCSTTIVIYSHVYVYQFSISSFAQGGG